ncbi:MAG TPA: hypothetical protein VL983_01410, partial [Terriglobales bacterium]|nr:hypothetical protein [Terriglobales bacterium]
IHQNRAEEMLNWVNVYPGEMIYVAGGTVHTMGPGSVLVETQQQSDTTYRLYDYGRPRPLHLERGLASVKERVASGKVIRPAPVSLSGGNRNSSTSDALNRRSSMVAAPYFVVDLLELQGPYEFGTADESGKNSAQILVVLEGCGIVEAPGLAPVTFAKGDAVVIPASLTRFGILPQWSIEFLKAYVPGADLPEPPTRM